MLRAHAHLWTRIFHCCRKLVTGLVVGCRITSDDFPKYIDAYAQVCVSVCGVYGVCVCGAINMSCCKHWWAGIWNKWRPMTWRTMAVSRPGVLWCPSLRDAHACRCPRWRGADRWASHSQILDVAHIFSKRRYCFAHSNIPRSRHRIYPRHTPSSEPTPHWHRCLLSKALISLARAQAHSLTRPPTYLPTHSLLTHSPHTHSHRLSLSVIQVMHPHPEKYCLAPKVVDNVKYLGDVSVYVVWFVYLSLYLFYLSVFCPYPSPTLHHYTTGT